MHRIDGLIAAPPIDRRLLERNAAMHDGNGWKLRRTAALLALTASVACVGCGGKAKLGNDDVQQTYRAMSAIATFYGRYLEAHGGAPPKNEEAFRKYLEANATSLKDRFQFEDVEKLLSTTRDGKPLAVVYGKVAPQSDGGSPWAVYEQTGVDGIRLAAPVRGGAVELTSEEFQRELPGR
jgi:hypothetical protein